MLRVGIVNQQDPATARVRVSFADLDQMRSYWLSVLVSKSQDDKSYYLPDIGEQVVCAMDERDEAGVVLGAIYSQVDAPPVSSADKMHITFKDGAAVEYDRAAHALSLALPDGATITISANGASLRIDSSGNVSVTAADRAALTASANGASVELDPTGNVLVSAATSGLILLSGGGAAVARVGDSVDLSKGIIASGSAKVQCG